MEARCRFSRRYGWSGELPGTLQRSCREAQELFTKAYNGAVQVYSEEDRAVRAAFSVLKQKFEKRGDQWVAKRDAEEVT
jgi:cation transport regulator ChaB